MLAEIETQVSAPQEVAHDPLEILNQAPVSSWPWPRILLGVPIERAMSHAGSVFHNFWGIAQQGAPIIKIGYGRTDVIRNKMAMQLLQSDYTHLLMLDLDHIHPIDIIQRLARWVIMDPSKQVVGGLNFRRGEPYEPCCFLKGANGKYYAPAQWERGLVKVNIIGTGSILIAREVFETIPPPWFYNIYEEATLDAWPGEDIGFSRECTKAGIDLWIDTMTTSPHMIDAYVDESSFRQYMADHPERVVMPYQEFAGLGGAK